MLKTIFLHFVCLLFLLSLGFSQDKRVGLLLDDTDSQRWSNDSLLFSLKVEWLGGEVLTGVANKNPSLQFQQAKDMIAQGAKVLVIVASDTKKAVKIVKYARKHDVRIIAYDRMILNAQVDYYVSFDNRKVGQLQAKFVADSMEDNELMILLGPVSDNNSYVLRDGQYDVLQAKIEDEQINVVYEKHLKEWDNKLAYSEVKHYLSKHPQNHVGAIIGSNDMMAQGIDSALVELGVDHPILITGQDGDRSAFERILSGHQSMTIYKPLSLTAEAAAILAMDIVNGKPIHIEDEHKYFNGLREVPFICIDPISVDRRNVNKYYR